VTPTLSNPRSPAAVGERAVADRSQRHWQMTVAGYALTAVCVPLLALAPLLGAAGVTVATTLILLERVGKAVRSPAKSSIGPVAEPGGGGDWSTRLRTRRHASGSSFATGGPVASSVRTRGD